MNYEIEKLLSLLDAQLIKLREINSIPAMQQALDELKRLDIAREKLEEALSKTLEKEMLHVPIGVSQTFGTYTYKKIENKGQSKLDESRLAEMVRDQDLLDTCYRVERKPLTQKDLQSHLLENGINIDVKQLYLAEVKEGYKIKLI